MYLVGVLQGAPDRKVELEGLEMEVVIQPGRQTAFIERLTTDRGAYRPGEQVRATVWVRPANAPTDLRPYSFTFRIPYDAMPGRYTLQAVAGGERAGFMPGVPAGLARLLLGGGGGTPSTEQVLREFQRRERNHQIVTTLTMQAMGATVQGEPLYQMPPLMREILTSPRASGIQPEPDQIKQVVSTDWVLQGSQMLFLTILPAEEGEQPPFRPPGMPGGVVMPVAPPAAEGEPEGFEAIEVATPPDMSDMPDASEWMPAGVSPAQPPAEGQRARETPISRAPKRWELTDFRTLQRGTMQGVAATTNGTLLLAPQPQQLARLELDYIWCMTYDARGSLYVGGGMPARLVVVNPDGTVQRTLNLPGLMVTALATASDGTVHAGVSPEGKVYRLREGQLEPLGSTDARYINALLAADGDDGRTEVYIATGVPARLLMWDRGVMRELLRSDEAHFIALTRDTAGNLIVGSAERGIVYRCSPGGVVQPIADLREPTISALACDTQGNLYIGTMPAGNLYRLSPEGALKPLHPQGGLDVRNLLIQGDTLYALTGERLYALRCGTSSEAEPLLLLLRQPMEFVCAAVSSTLVLASAYEAQLWRLHTQQEGTYLSPVLDAGQQASWGMIRWLALGSEGTQISIQTRSGNTREPDSSWSAWSEPYPNAEGSPILSPPARFLQVRVRLAGMPSPEVRALNLTYMPANRPPVVQLLTPKPYTVWSDKQTIRWSARDPDGDALRFEVQISSDGGKSWQKLKDALKEPAAQPSAAGIPDTQQLMQELQQALESSPDIPAEIRAQIEAQAPQLIQQVQTMMKQLPSVPPSMPPSMPARVAEPTPPATPRQMEWDTTKTPDGVYLLRLKASDQPAQPSHYAEVFTPAIPVVICNTPPALSARQERLKVNDDRTVELSGYALQLFSAAPMSDRSDKSDKSDKPNAKPKRTPRHSVPIVGIQYRIDKGEWFSAEPLDGMFDSAFEMFHLKTEPLQPGEYTLTLKAFNAAGRSVEQELKVKIPAPSPAPPQK
jgi:sugar lactone lactonase YvrE